MHTCMNTHRGSGEGAQGGRSRPEGNLIPLQLHGNYRLWKHRLTWHFYPKEANGQWAPPPTHRITPHCRQVWNSPLEPQQTQEKKKVDQRPAYISQLLAVPWRDEWQLEKLHCYSDSLSSTCSVNKVILHQSLVAPIFCVLMFRQLHCI